MALLQNFTNPKASHNPTPTLRLTLRLTVSITLPLSLDRYFKLPGGELLRYHRKSDAMFHPQFLIYYLLPFKSM